MKESQSFKHLNTDQIKNLMECMAVCKSCAKMCIDEGHQKTAISCIDCADICDLALKFSSCGSEFKDQALELCGQVCKKCAAECDKMQVQHCKECAVICKECSETCARSPAKS